MTRRSAVKRLVDAVVFLPVLVRVDVVLDSPSRQPCSRTPLRKLALIIGLFLLVPVIPFLLLGESFEVRLLERFQDADSPFRRILLLVGLLAGDLFLPVPSSGVLTYAGASLGFVAATVWSLLGMMLGGMVGYELARVCGSRVLERWVGSEDREMVERFFQQWGLLALVITRPLPLLAEATVLLAGYGRLRRLGFYGILLLSNLVICAGYVTLGVLFGQEEYFGLVLVLSLMVPLLVTLGVKSVLKPGERHTNSQHSD